MSRKKGKKRYRGHYCWCCGRIRPNEKFSGKGHAKHLCRDCSKLGAEELAHRQAMRDLERCMTWEGIIPRKRRKAFERFLEHENERIRAVARQMAAEDKHVRAEWREMRRLEEAEEQMLDDWRDVPLMEDTAENPETSASYTKDIPY